MKLKSLFLALAGLSHCLPASADIAVLVHGYLSDSGTWMFHGVDAELQRAGWVPAGSQAEPTDKVYYNVNLPSLAPAPVQSSWLKNTLDQISAAHPSEPITLIGHSAGGVVARMMLVQYGSGKVNHLITLASPHLGTERAIQALDATDESGFFAPIKEWFVRNEVGNNLYDTVQYSRPLLADLLPARPGSMLFWLNSQPHPDIRYTSVIHSNTAMAGDMVVPAFSQDMNQVPALRGKSQVVMSIQPHDLTPLDGKMLANLLN